jgi:hypothetical protein
MLVGDVVATMAEEVHDTVAILDAGAQYGKLIDRAVRELNVKTALLPLSATPEEIKAGGYKVRECVCCVSLSHGAPNTLSLHRPREAPSAWPGVALDFVCPRLCMVATWP